MVLLLSIKIYFVHIFLVNAVKVHSCRHASYYSWLLRPKRHFGIVGWPLPFSFIYYVLGLDSNLPTIATVFQSQFYRRGTGLFLPGGRTSVHFRKHLHDAFSVRLRNRLKAVILYVLNDEIRSPIFRVSVPQLVPLLRTKATVIWSKHGRDRRSSCTRR